MSTDLQYSNLISEVNSRFPAFEKDLGDTTEMLSDNVSVYFTFFSIYVKEHWADANLLQQLSCLLRDMSLSADDTTQMTLNDLLLDLCSSCKEHGIDVEPLLQKLEPALQNRMRHINNGWLAAACELPRGGCC